MTEAVVSTLTHKTFTRLREEVLSNIVALEPQERRHLHGEPDPSSADLQAVQEYYKTLVEVFCRL